MILPAGSPLVQFEVTGFPHGGRILKAKVPVVVFVDRNTRPSWKCPNDKQIFALPSRNGDYPVLPLGSKSATAGVCLCMGRFIE